MRIDHNLRGLIILLLFVVIFGGWQGLINVGIVTWFLIGLIFTLLVTFFFWDVILIIIKWILSFFNIRKRPS